MTSGDQCEPMMFRDSLAFVFLYPQQLGSPAQDLNMGGPVNTFPQMKKSMEPHCFLRIYIVDGVERHIFFRVVNTGEV